MIKDLVDQKCNTLRNHVFHIKTIKITSNLLHDSIIQFINFRHCHPFSLFKDHYRRNVFHLNYEVACTRWHALGGVHYRPLWRTTNTFQCFPVRIYPWQPAQIHDLFTEDCQCPRVSVISMIWIYRWQLAQIHDIFTVQYFL